MSDRKHWIIRIGDGKNFKNSKHPIWGFSNNCVKKLTKGDILWFLTSKDFGGKIIGMAEYVETYNRREEVLVTCSTFSNEEMGWEGGEEGKWYIQILYTNLYDTERQNICAVLPGQQKVYDYEDYVSKIEDNLYEHYKGFIFYGTPKKV